MYFAKSSKKSCFTTILDCQSESAESTILTILRAKTQIFVKSAIQTKSTTLFVV